MRRSRLDNANTRSRPPSEVVAHYLEAIYYIRAEGEVERLEHAVSEVVEETLYRALGRPTSCPHGNPIPGHSTMRANELRLSALKPGETGTITRISEVAQREAPPLLQYLHDRGLTPGTRITVQEVDEIGRTMQLQAARLLTLSNETASKLSVVRSARAQPRRAAAPR